MNIFTYNAASGGDELYGMEPISYYIKNLFLNLNFVAPLGIVVLPMIIFTQLREVDLVVLTCPLYLWLAITVPRPHQEERFLFPIYPLLCLGAVLTVDKIANFVGRVMSGLSRHKELMREQRHGIHIGVWIIVATLAVSRTWALYKYYSAPMYIFASLNHHHAHDDSGGNSDSRIISTVCTCGEWYRYPSSFFLPHNMQLVFLESSFKGQLPQPFTQYGSRVESQQYLQPFNDQNKEEPSRYGDVNSCDYIVDLQDGACAPNNAEIVGRHPFLDAGHTTALHRILYVPYLHEYGVTTGSVQYTHYNLYKMPKQR
jgi:alpha-1,2-mannosyltransferase